MRRKHEEHMEALVKAVFNGNGVTDLRTRIAIKTAVASGADSFEIGDEKIPTVLRPFLQKVSRHAYKVTDGDVEALKATGYSEDAIFELAVSAAVAAGLFRLERGLTLLGSPPLGAGGGWQ